MRWRVLWTLLLGAGFGCRNAPPGEGGIEPWVDQEQDLAQIGYDQTFHIDLRKAPPPARHGQIQWAQVAGPPLRDIATSEQGFYFSARMPALRELVPEGLAWGIVPVSPRTRCEVVLEAEWRSSSGSSPQRRRFPIAAAARSRGLPNVPVQQRLYLASSGWRVLHAPPGAKEMLHDEQGQSSLLPDAAGTWELVDGDGRTLRIQAGRYDQTPLDCSRGGCHSELADAARKTAMTSALARRLAAHDTNDEPSCAIACHATGEPGTHDGGFLDVAAELGMPHILKDARDLRDLPRPLRRLGSVGCLACHGPSALPEAEARWSILRSDVCAYCHDAPPRYGHVAGWRASTMATADRQARAASDDKCVGCHTTWGFLQLGAVVRSSELGERRRPPKSAGPVGITCAACHSVHATGHGDREVSSLLREIRLPELFSHLPESARSRSGTCLLCHTPAAPLAEASEGAIWAGRGGIDPETGAPLAGPAPHLMVAGGCLGCHDQGPSGIARGASHAFRANRGNCAPCHPSTGRDILSFEAEARELWDRLRKMGVVDRDGVPDNSLPQHATDTLRASPSSPLGRAAFDVSLVLGDRAAGTHNPAYARILLEASKQWVDRAAQGRRGGAKRRLP